MTDTKDSWTTEGVGAAPQVAWSLATDGKLADLDLAWEADETLIADDAGGLSLIDAAGRLRQLSRGLSRIECVAFSGSGSCAAIAYDSRKVALVDRSLSIGWSMTLYDQITGLAIDPFGRHIAVALGNRDVRIYTTSRRRVAEIEVVRPLRFLRFSTTEPRLVGAAEDGLLVACGINGKLIWDQRLFATCGDLTASGDLSTVLLAGFAHGIQRFDADGTSRGAFVIEGTPSRLAVSYDGSRIAAATLERQVYFMDRGGTLRWAATAPEEVERLACDAAGRSIIVGFASGRVIRLAWGGTRIEDRR